MRKYLILLSILTVLGLEAKALEVVYPKTNPAKISAPSTFFIGSVTPDEKISIDGVEVQTSKIGAFAYSVPLNYGINNFKLDTGKNMINFIIERPIPKVQNNKPSQLIEYPPMDNFYVKTDSTPLRTTPVDGGINRLSHLPAGTNVTINGEKGIFYRVYLNSNTIGWIAKSALEEKEEQSEKTVLKNVKTKEHDDFCIYEFELNKKAPFIIKEENGLTLQLFNLNKQNDNTYCINIPVDKLFGYDIYYKNNELILKIRKPHEISIKKPLENLKIAVDAGHGGCENGAIGGCGDKEKDINLTIAKNLKDELEKRGAKVIMTREDDRQVTLQDRVNLIKEKNATISLSIHSNALPDGKDPIKNRGTSVYYYHNQAKPLAENILKSMTSQLGTQNDKVRQGSLALVRPTSSVSILIEVAYIINPYDYTLLLDKTFQVNCAKAIADGIENYLLN